VVEFQNQDLAQKTFLDNSGVNKILLSFAAYKAPKTGGRMLFY
jgi:hypothetical protein